MKIGDIYHRRKKGQRGPIKTQRVAVVKVGRKWFTVVPWDDAEFVPEGQGYRCNGSIHCMTTLDEKQNFGHGATYDLKRSFAEWKDVDDVKRCRSLLGTFNTPPLKDISPDTARIVRLLEGAL